MRNKMLKLSGAAAAHWEDPAAPWSQANGSAGDAAPVAAAAAWAAYRGPSLDLGLGGGAANGHAGWALPTCLWHWALELGRSCASCWTDHESRAVKAS